VHGRRGRAHARRRSGRSERPAAAARSRTRARGDGADVRVVRRAVGDRSRSRRSCWRTRWPSCRSRSTPRR
jgi:hypothetical protein